MNYAPDQPAFIGKDASVRHHLQAFAKQLADPHVTEICVNRPKQIYSEAGGHWHAQDDERITYDFLKGFVIAVARYSDNEISPTRPILSATLPDGERMQAVISPACEAGTVSITIRKPSKQIRSFDSYVNSGFFNHVKTPSAGLTTFEREMLSLKDNGDTATLLKKAVHAGLNIVLAGETGSGKTTFMKTLMQEIPAQQRIITIEDVPELTLPRHDNHVHLFYTSETGAGAGESITTSASLLKSCMRMKPDRILLAELRGAETFDFINVCASGHGGSITSCHAGTPELTFERLAMMILSNEQGRTLPYEVIRKLLYLVVDVIVCMTDDNDGHGRHITELWYEPEQQRTARVGGAPELQSPRLDQQLTCISTKVDEIHDVVHSSALVLLTQGEHHGRQ